MADLALTQAAGGGALGAQLGPIAGQADLDSARGAAERADDGQIEQAAKQFESLLATVMIKELRRGLKDGFFGSGAGSDVFDGWLDEHLGSALAETGALDVAGFIRVNLSGAQGAEAPVEPREAAAAYTHNAMTPSGSRDARRAVGAGGEIR